MPRNVGQGSAWIVRRHDGDYLAYPAAWSRHDKWTPSQRYAWRFDDRNSAALNAYDRNARIVRLRTSAIREDPSPDRKAGVDQLPIAVATTTPAGGAEEAGASPVDWQTKGVRLDTPGEMVIVR